jgi:hypothetical protein
MVPLNVVMGYEFSDPLASAETITLRFSVLEGTNRIFGHYEIGAHLKNPIGHYFGLISLLASMR